jgi:dihydrofolate reductase
MLEQKLLKLEGILALDEYNGLSLNGLIPWKSKTDMSFFKNITMNNIVIMGSNTLLSLPSSKPLVNRLNVIVTNNKDKYLNNYSFYENILFMNYDECIHYIFNYTEDKTIYVIGGKQIYNLFLPYCTRIWITRIKGNYNCDLTFKYNFTDYNIESYYEDDEIKIMLLSV